MEDNGVIRKFETGATRDTSTNKNDYEGFLSPLVIEAFGDYMSENRLQKDGSVRDSDNWQKGIPKAVYVKSAFRHFMQFWKLHRGLECKDENGKPVDLKHAICGLLFNAMGYLHESLKSEALAATKLEPGELRSILNKVPEPPKAPAFPRFFYQPKNELTSGSIYVIVSEAVGTCFSIGDTSNTCRDRWANVNWCLKEMFEETSQWGVMPVPVEITAEQAVSFGLPNATAKWPVTILKVWPGGTSRIPIYIVPGYIPQAGGLND